MLSVWMHPGLQRRVMAYVTAGLAILFGFLVYFTMLAVRQAQEQVYHENISLAGGMAKDVVQDFEYMASDLRVIIGNVKLSEGNFQAVADTLYESILSHAPRQFFRVSSITLFDEQGNLLATSPPSAGVLNLPGDQLRSVLAENKLAILRPYDNAGANRFALAVVPLQRDPEQGRSLLIVADTVGLGGILPVIPGGEKGYSMEIVEVNGGTIVAASNAERIGKISEHYTFLQKDIGEGSSAIEEHEADGFTNADYVVAVTPLPKGPFYLTLQQPADIALAVPHRLQSQMLIIAVVSIPFFLGAAWITARRVVRPVEQLRMATRAIASGNFDDPIKVAAQDEVADLANDAEAMRQQLKKSLYEIEQARSKLEQTVAERTQRLTELLGKIIGAQERERQRLAREIHDEQSQTLSALLLMLNRVGRLLGNESNEVKGEIERAQNTTQNLLDETRRLIYDLRPSVLDDMGLEAAIRWCSETHLESKGVKVNLNNSLPRRLDGIIEVALFRVAQEAITNIARHSRAKNVDIKLAQADTALSMRISDDGDGFVRGSTENSPQTSGLGLQGMEERVRLIGGNIDIISSIGRGTKIEVNVPLNRGGTS